MAVSETCSQQSVRFVYASSSKFYSPVVNAHSALMNVCSALVNVRSALRNEVYTGTRDNFTVAVVNVFSCLP